MKNAKILIVEDEGIIAEHLKIILQNAAFEKIQVAHDKSSAINAIESFRPDLALLDIRLDQKTEGIDVANEINNKLEIPFIFITAHSDNQLLTDALATKPSGFITKPFKQPDVVAAVNIALLKNQKPSVFKFKNGYDDVIIHSNEILFVKSEKNYIDIICKDKRFCLRNSLDWFLSEIDNANFVKVHRSYIVNLKHAHKLTANEISVSTFSIPVSRSNLPQIRTFFERG